MSQTSNRDIELAEQRVGQELANGIATASARLSGPGRDSCIDCGNPIHPARREVMPSAERCVSCQEIFERAP